MGATHSRGFSRYTNPRTVLESIESLLLNTMSCVSFMSSLMTSTKMSAGITATSEGSMTSEILSQLVDDLQVRESLSLT